MVTVDDAKDLIIQKFPRKAGSRGFPALVEAMIDNAGEMIWRERKWSFAKATQAPPGGSYISFVPGTYDYTLEDDFLYPVYAWCKECSHPSDVQILSPEQLRERHQDYTLIVGCPKVCTFEGIRKMQLYGDTSANVGLIYQKIGGASELLSQDSSFLFIIVDAVLSMVHDAGSSQEMDAFARFWQRLESKARMDASHFEPTIKIKPDPLYQKLQKVRRAF